MVRGRRQGMKKHDFGAFGGAFWLPFGLHFGAVGRPGVPHGAPKGALGSSFPAPFFQYVF